MSDTVQQIKDKLNIIDVISPYVELHKAGKNFKGKSPFAAEKTPSFYVSPDRGMYYCFSTSQGGDIFNFIQVMEGVDFKESLRILAEKAGIELIKEDPQKRSEREKLYSVLESATSFFVECLDKEPEAQKYLSDRGVTADTILRWKIGYAPGPPHHGWREAKSHLEEKSFTTEQLYKTGLIKSTEGGKDPFDVFRDRIMFPMSEPNGKVVAFSGRILHPDERSPKYVNSPETELYKKSDLLYGYDKAKAGIRNLDFSLIVEGQFDVVMCHQAGYGNTVAVSGTALTINHVQLLERLSDKVVLALDADKAGINAMKRGADLMLRRGLDVKVAEMPIGKDPADIIREDKNSFKKIIGQSLHMIEFLLHVLRREEADDRNFKRKVKEEVLPFVLLLPSRIDQEHFVKSIAKTIDTSSDAVRFELDRLRERTGSVVTQSKTVRETAGETAKDKEISLNSLESTFAFLLASKEVVDKKMSNQIEESLKTFYQLDKLPKPNESELARLVFTLEQQFNDLPELSVVSEVVSKLNILRTNLLRKAVNEARRELQQTEEDGNDKNFTKLLQQITDLEKEMRVPAFYPETFLD
jgi:DNA primase